MANIKDVSTYLDHALTCMKGTHRKIAEGHIQAELGKHMTLSTVMSHRIDVVLGITILKLSS